MPPIHIAARASSASASLSAAFQPAGHPLLAQQNIGELYATDASVKGSVILAGSGTSVLSGSQIAAGAQTATLKLERGGSVLVCPGTSLSVSSSQSGRQLLFSVSSGNIELDYPIGSASDSLLTPDFRLLLPGPGQIHVAMRVTANGDTCVQSLPSNSSSLVVAEAMGDASYQVKQDEAVFFKGGRIQGATAAPTKAADALRPRPCKSRKVRLRLQRPCQAAADQRSRIGCRPGRIRPCDDGHPPLYGSSVRLQRRRCTA